MMRGFANIYRHIPYKNFPRYSDDGIIRRLAHSLIEGWIARALITTSSITAHIQNGRVKGF